MLIESRLSKILKKINSLIIKIIIKNLKDKYKKILYTKSKYKIYSWWDYNTTSDLKLKFPKTIISNHQ